MIEKSGDIWESRQPGDWIVITTNGTLRRDGKLVMGRGIALEASQRYKYLQARLGYLIQRNGLQLELLEPDRLIAFPVKYEFYEKADLNLILKSTIQLVDAQPRLHGRVLLPRPGCGNGKLDWIQVEPILRHYLLDDRFIVFHQTFRRDLKCRT